MEPGGIYLYESDSLSELVQIIRIFNNTTITIIFNCLNGTNDTRISFDPSRFSMPSL